MSATEIPIAQVRRRGREEWEKKVSDRTCPVLTRASWVTTIYTTVGVKCFHSRTSWHSAYEVRGQLDAPAAQFTATIIVFVIFALWTSHCPNSLLCFVWHFLLSLRRVRWRDDSRWAMTWWQLALTPVQVDSGGYSWATHWPLWHVNPHRRERVAFWRHELSRVLYFFPYFFWSACKSGFTVSPRYQITFSHTSWQSISRLLSQHFFHEMSLWLDTRSGHPNFQPSSAAAYYWFISWPDGGSHFVLNHPALCKSISLNTLCGSCLTDWAQHNFKPVALEKQGAQMALDASVSIRWCLKPQINHIYWPPPSFFFTGQQDPI